MAKSTQSNPPREGAEGASGGDKLESSGREIEITSANSFPEVLDYDQKGFRIMFACEKGQFLVLKDAEIAQLSRFTKTVYQAMKSQNAVMEAEDPSWEKIKADLKVGDTRGSARARMTVTAKDPARAAKMETRTFRPDNIGRGESLGWVPAKLSDYSMPGSHIGHLSIKAHGEDELVLMERPKEFRIANDKARRQAKADRSKAEKEEFKEAVARAGYNSLSDEAVANGRYKEIE